MWLELDAIKNGMNELKVLKEHKLINLVDYLADGSCRLKPNILTKTGAVYVFWWTGSISDFLDDKVNRIIGFKGPNGRLVDMEFSDSWIENIQINGKIPLYVGKTADSLQNRISQHLQLKSKRGLSLGNSALNEKRKTTSNQVRDRIERMFINESDTRNLMLKNIGLSYVFLHGDLECANRLYLEDKAIGELYPLFNIDIER